jgi:hypothetical protein
MELDFGGFKPGGPNEKQAVTTGKFYTISAFA